MDMEPRPDTVWWNSRLLELLDELQVAFRDMPEENSIVQAKKAFGVSDENSVLEPSPKELFVASLSPHHSRIMTMIGLDVTALWSKASESLQERIWSYVGYLYDKALPGALFETALRPAYDEWRKNPDNVDKSLDAYVDEIQTNYKFEVKFR
jgi:hypothetical protein